MKGSKMLHRPLAEAIVQNSIARNKKNGIKLLEDVGYSPVTARSSYRRTIESKNVQKELELLGFTTLNAKRVIGEILNSPVVYEMVTPDNQLRAASEIFKVNADYAPDKVDIRQVSIAHISFNKPK